MVGHGFFDGGFKLSISDVVSTALDQHLTYSALALKTL
jgi:hypothetical protein